MTVGWRGTHRCVSPFEIQHCWGSEACKGDALQSHRPPAWCASPLCTPTFQSDFSAPSQGSGTRERVSSAQSLQFTEDLSAEFHASNLCFTVPGRYSQYLKKADVNLISQTLCKTRAYYENQITENMLCAGSPDWSADACKVRQGQSALYVSMCVRTCTKHSSMCMLFLEYGIFLCCV